MEDANIVEGNNQLENGLPAASKQEKDINSDMEKIM